MRFYTKKKMAFYTNICQTIALLLDQGVSLQKIFVILKKKYSGISQQKSLDIILNRLNQGIPFSQALHQVVPSPYEVSCSPPQLSVYLTHIVIFIQSQYEIQKACFKELKYPGFLLMTTLGIFILFFSTLLPLFLSLNQEKNNWPKLIQLLFMICNFKSLALLITGVLLVLILSHRWVLRKMKKFFLPYEIANQIWLLAVLLKSGVSVKDALEGLFKDNSNVFYRSNSIVETLSSQWHLTPFQKELFQIGHDSSQIPHFLMMISDQIKQERQEALITKIRYIQPVLLIIISLLILLCFYLIFMPVMTLSQQL